MATLQDFYEIEYCREDAEHAGMVFACRTSGGKHVLALSMDTKKFPNYTEDNIIYSASTVEELTAFIRGWQARPMHDKLGVKK